MGLGCAESVWVGSFIVAGDKGQAKAAGLLSLELTRGKGINCQTLPDIKVTEIGKAFE